MRIDILTLFPEMFPGYLDESILKRAQENGRLTIHLHNIRDYASDKHRVTDEPPYGGGGGMVLKPGPIFRAVESVVGSEEKIRNSAQRQTPENPSSTPDLIRGHRPWSFSEERPPLILLTPQGRPFTQTVAQELAQYPHLMLLCGRYEGVDERVRQHLVTDEISIGDYVLTGGELAAMVLVDAITRLLPDVLGAEGAAETDSYATGLLEGPHYTRPPVFRGWDVPEVLLSGHAANIARWRRQEALRRTWQRRPDLLRHAPLTEADKWFLAVLAEEEVGSKK